MYTQRSKFIAGKRRVSFWLFIQNAVCKRAFFRIRCVPTRTLYCTYVNVYRHTCIQLAYFPLFFLPLIPLWGGGGRRRRKYKTLLTLHKKPRKLVVKTVKFESFIFILVFPIFRRRFLAVFGLLFLSYPSAFRQPPPILLSITISSFVYGRIRGLPRTAFFFLSHQYNLFFLMRRSFTSRDELRIISRM